jgi:hypothetical protein
MNKTEQVNDYTTKSFFFNVGLNAAIYLALFLVFLVLKYMRDDKKQLGKFDFRVFESMITFS